MQHLRGFLIILACLYGGQFMAALLPLQLPGLIYGMILLLILLCVQIIKLEWVASPADFLISIMLIMFVPGGVNIITVQELLAGKVLALLLTIVFSTAIIIIVTALTVDFFIELQRKRINES